MTQIATGNGRRFPVERLGIEQYAVHIEHDGFGASQRREAGSAVAIHRVQPSPRTQATQVPAFSVGRQKGSPGAPEDTTALLRIG